MTQLVIITVAIVLILVILFINRRQKKANVLGASSQAVRRAGGGGAEPLVQVEKSEPYIDELEPSEAEESFSAFAAEMTDSNEIKPSPTAAEVEAPVSVDEIPEIITLYVVAKPGRRFAGYDLLQNLLALGMRYGEMDIFHRHEIVNGREEILFSLASAEQPGTFDLSTMNEQTYQGLTVFLQLPNVSQPRHAFQEMLQLLQQLSTELNGDLKVGPEVPLTESMIRQFHLQAQAYESYLSAAK